MVGSHSIGMEEEEEEEEGRMTAVAIPGLREWFDIDNGDRSRADERVRRVLIRLLVVVVVVVVVVGGMSRRIAESG
jgi:hypothetical protein